MFNFKERIIDTIKANPYVIIFWLMKYSGISYFSDYVFLKTTWRLHMGYPLNLKAPQSFNEKLQWIKLYDRNPLYTTMVDKYLAKKYVKGIIGEEYIIPTIGIWDNLGDINVEALPQKFVLKCTHDSGSIVICRDKRNFSFKEAKRKLSIGLNTNYYRLTREWPYKNVKRRIIAEQFLEELSSDDLIDYKFFCFNGVPIYCQVIKDRNKAETIDFFDMEWKHQDFIGLGLNPDVLKYSKDDIEKPKNFETMILLSKKLSRNIPFVRVDFYNLDGKIYFGELTFFPTNGMGRFYPLIWNNKIGNLLELNI